MFRYPWGAVANPLQPRDQKGNYVHKDTQDCGGLTNDLQIGVSTGGRAFRGFSVFGGFRTGQISAVELGCFSAEERGGNDTHGDHQNPEQLGASRNLIEVVYIGLPKKSEHIIKKMGKDGAEQGTGSIESHGEDDSREKIQREVPKIEMQEREEEGADRHGAKDAATLVFPTQDPTVDKFLAKGGENGVCHDQI